MKNINDHIFINIINKQEETEIFGVLNDLGYCWNSGNVFLPCNNVCVNNYKDKTVVNINNYNKSLTYCDIAFYKRTNAIILKFSELGSAGVELLLRLQ